ncbi:hypothetical protein S40288_11584 [Stachybotrys chartarum IBT 40288]|nr:hypothetical protein S40288_11584 [Stachybotrys chartarum IBT 40288]
MATNFEYGFTLPNGVHIVHGEGALGKDAFPSEINIPGRLFEFSPGHAVDARTPAFCGAQGCYEFDIDIRMPRHVHLSRPGPGEQRFVVEKIFIPYGVALAEFGGELYVIPPKTLILIAAGIPHTWTACPPGLNVTKALGLTDEEGKEVISDGKFMAVYEYEEPTGFFPTAQTNALHKTNEYIRCEDLHSIRIPKFGVDEVLQKASIVWGKNARKAAPTESQGF